MALSSATVVEIRLAGNDTNGGGFVTGAAGTDWSQQDAAQYAVADGVTNGSTVITSASAGFGTDVVGNLVYVQGGGGAVSSGWYQIITRTSSTTIVVDRATGLTSGTSTTLKIGGALASPGQAANILTVAGQVGFIKYYSSASYTITSTAISTPNGLVNGTGATAYCGYDVTRSLYNLDANRPTIQLSTGLSGAFIFTNINAVYYVQSLILDANNAPTSRCAQMSGEYFYVKGMNGVTAGLSQNSNTGRAILCEVTGCSAIPINLFNLFDCYAHDNTLTSPTNNGAVIGNGVISNTISINNNCIGIFPGTASVVSNCVAYNNTLSGIDCINNTNITIINCISESNSSLGYSANTGQFTAINCASYNNSARIALRGAGKIWGDINPITGTGSFFTSSTNFTLNNTAGAGAAARAAGFPSSWPAPSMSNFADVGALQSSAGGGGTTTTAIYGVMGS
jgi:hypothetical protein